MRWEKIKNVGGSAISFGLLAVYLQYGPYVFGQQSKWFVFGLMFKFCSVGVFGTVVLFTALM